ncbi:MAG: 5-formyltetrahydrofolate cyclo-ligase [Elusimicrobiota bacterium]
MKRKLRDKHKKLRSSFDKDRKKKLDKIICNKIKNSTCFKKAKNIMFYIAHSGEPDISCITDDFSDKKKNFYLPRIKSSHLEVAKIEGFDSLIIGKYKIPEPPPQSETIPREKLDVIFIPGLCFTPSGIRLGRGGGYYDRFLAGIDPAVKKIGICYSFQIEKDIPCCAHDVGVDEVITDK